MAQPGIFEEKVTRDTLRKTGQQLGAYPIVVGSNLRPTTLDQTENELPGQQLKEQQSWLEILRDCGHMEPVKQCPEEGINNKQVNIMCSEAFPLARVMAWCGGEMCVVDKDLGSDVTDTEAATEAARQVQTPRPTGSP